MKKKTFEGHNNGAIDKSWASDRSDSNFNDVPFMESL